MKKISILLKRFIAGLFLGNGLTNKLRASFGLLTISRIHPINFLIKSPSKPIPITINTGSDAAMFVEIFFDKEYQFDADLQPKTILDIGANVGFASLFLAGRFPYAKIVALEPDPTNYALLRKNVINAEQITSIEAAVAATSGEMDFYPVSGQGMSSSFQQRFNSKKISVKTFSIDDLLKKMNWNKLDLLKFDIEGAEWEVFSSLSLGKINSLIGEFHADLTGHTAEEFVALFPGFKAKILKQLGSRYIIFFER